MTALADPSLAQRMTALQRANLVRTENARLKKRIGEMSSRDGLCFVVGFLGSDAAAESSLRVLELLSAPRQVGSVKARKWCSRVPVPADRRVKDLTARQRVVLAGFVADAVERVA